MGMIDEFGGIAAPRRPIHCSLNDVLTFGRYEGRTIGYVLEENPSYLVWAHDNTERVKLSSELYGIAVDEMQDMESNEEAEWLGDDSLFNAGDHD